MTSTRQLDANKAAIRDVQEQMTVLAGHVKAGIRDAALALDPALRPFGLKLLVFLSHSGPTQASAAADALFVDRSAISREARQLEALGLIELQPDPEDGRVRYLALTAEAERKLAATQAAHQLPVLQHMVDWPTEDVRMFASLLERLNKSIG